MEGDSAGAASGISRRRFLRLAGAVAIPVASASAQDRALETLIRQNRRSDFGQGFDAGSHDTAPGRSLVPVLSRRTAEATEQAIPRYANLVASGGWPEVPQVGGMSLGARGSAVAILRQRLIVSGDLHPRLGVTDVYDSYVDAAVSGFQARHGLSVDGTITVPTLNALNVPAPVRLEQLRTNLVRLRTFSGELGHRFVLCNIPATQIEAVENGTIVSRHGAVVGKPDRPSPDIQSRIVEINFNPYWTVPISIVRKDLIPKMQTQPDYLTVNRIRIFDARGYEVMPAQINWYSNEAMNYRFKQDPGDFNSLGSIRINFPSVHGVYMHDTPLKNLFGEDFRFHSSGCVRVQNVRELVHWLLEGTSGWSRGEIDNVIRTGERRDARVARGVPLYWVYVTAWAGPDGIVQFRDDIYGRDGFGPLATSIR